MLKDKLAIDEKDMKLLSLLMHDPSISQQDLAKKLDLSQPSINVRLHKLKKRGVLVQTAGIDAKRSDLALVRVDFTCADAEDLLHLLLQCSFFVNGFLMSGTRNVCVFLVAEDLMKVEHIVNKYLRANTKVSNIELSVVVSTAKEFICVIDIDKEHSSACADLRSCKACMISKSKK